MAQLSLPQQKELVQKVASTEAKKKQERFESRLTMQLLVEGVAGLVAAPAAGFVAGKFDTKFDTVSGDGIKVMGLPLIPLLGAAVAGAGYYMGGTSGAAVRGVGLAAVHGSLYQMGFNAGSKPAA